MSTFGNVLFSASPFVRWTLTPVLLCFVIFFPMALTDWDAKKALLLLVLEIMALALLAGFWLPRRLGSIAFRVVAAFVFLGYLAYLVSSLQDWRAGKAPLAGSTSRVSPLSALLGLVVIGLPALVYAWKGRFSFQKDSDMEAVRRREHEKLLLQPDWAWCERVLGRPVPPALHELYADEQLVTSGALDYSEECSISTFMPLQEAWLTEGFAAIVFASSMFGDPIYLKAGRDESNQVFITYHDGGDTEVLAESVDEFLQLLTRANQVT